VNLAQMMTSRHGVTTSSVEQFLQGYARTLNDTRFTDFEPDGIATDVSEAGLRIMGGLRGELLRRSRRRCQMLTSSSRLATSVRAGLGMRSGSSFASQPNRGTVARRHRLAGPARYERSSIHVYCAGIDAEARTRLEAAGLTLEHASERPIGRMKPVIPLLEFASRCAKRRLARDACATACPLCVAAWSDAECFWTRELKAERRRSPDRIVRTLIVVRWVRFSRMRQAVDRASMKSSRPHRRAEHSEMESPVRCLGIEVTAPRNHTNER